MASEQKADPPAGISLLSAADDSTWRLHVRGAPQTLYADETYTLCVRFGARYPFDSPEVTFEGEAPVHPHIYENGHICLSILDRDW